MKHYYRLVILLGCFFITGPLLYADTVTYSSPNAKTDPGVTESSMIHVNLKDLLDITRTNSRGGIIAAVQPGGVVHLKMYLYDASGGDGRGPMIYECMSTSPSFGSTYVEDGMTYNVGGIQWWHGPDVTWNTIDIRSMAMNVGLVGYTSSSSFASGQSFLNKTIAVIVETEVTNALVKKVKVPGKGEYFFSQLYAGAPIPFVQVGGDVMLASHRGNWQGVTASENTNNAIKGAINEQYDMIELDLWQTSDDQVIVFHDQGLNKRTIQTGSVKAKTWNQIKDLYIKNRFDEVIQSNNTKIMLLSDVLDSIKTNDATGQMFINLDRSANDMAMFKQVYQIVAGKNMLNRTIFKGRFSSTDDPTAPTVTSMRQAFTDMFPSVTQAERDKKMQQMLFTPVLFDNNVDLLKQITNDVAYATKVKQYIDTMINTGIADGFELNFKSYNPFHSTYANNNDNNVFLLKLWPVLGDASTPTRNFVEYVHSKGLPVGIFASVPEVCAIPDFNADGTRNTGQLVSGFVKEDVPGGTNTPLVPYNPKVQDQGIFDFRGDWEFYIPAGVDFVISDRPDALRVYLKAIGRYK